MLLKSLIDEGVRAVSGMYPEREAREMVFAYLEDRLGTRRHTHIVEPEYMVPDDEAAEALDAFWHMSSGEPLQYVLGKAWFYGRPFHVTPDVLIPRPETELLVNNILAPADCKQCYRIIDLCTGSGCIAWTLALEMPGVQVTAVDISDGALQVASAQDFSEEISRTGALSPIFVKADVLNEHLDLSAGRHIPENVRFDIIVSNPPYVMDSEKALMRTNVLDHEPHLALFVPDNDPLVFYRAISRHAAALLSPDGIGIVEINEALGDETADVFRADGFTAEVIKDLSDKNRFVRFSRRYLEFC